MTEPTPLAALEGAVVRYGAGGPTIGPVNLSVGRGEIVALCGASGCGKSTALRLLAGLETPVNGRVQSPEGRGRTALVFQAPTLMPWASARANVALPLRLARASAEEADRAADAALFRVGLAGREDARPAELSGGMAMRVSLARALVTGPDLLLLDEPFAALDSITRRALIEDLHHLWADTGPAVVFVTHDVDEAVYVASRLLVMGEGGRVTDRINCPGPLPRTADWRSAAPYRQSIEQAAAALARAMAAAA